MEGSAVMKVRNLSALLVGLVLAGMTPTRFVVGGGFDEELQGSLSGEMVGDQAPGMPEELVPFGPSHGPIMGAESPSSMAFESGGDLVGMSHEEWLKIPAESLVINPIRDPESWRAAATWPGDRGLILALVPAPGDEAAEPVEILLWAVRYAASLGGRGLDRVAVAGMLPITKAAPDPAEAEKRIALLERLVELSAANEETLRAELDSRAFQPIKRPQR